MIVVMPTCDSHARAAEASGKLLAKYWPDHPPLHVIHHEARPAIARAQFHYAGPQSAVAWLEAIRGFLRDSTEATFILLLDDYAACAAPNMELIERADQLLRGTSDAGLFALAWYPAAQRTRISMGIDRLDGCPVLLQAAIWRRDWFLELAAAVNPRCSPWGFEAMATQAAKKIPGKILGADVEAGCSCGSGRLIDGMDKSAWPLPYHNLMHRGRWAEEHVGFMVREGIDFPSRGLGDAIAKAVHAIGLDAFAPASCGCEARRDQLNHLIPFAPKA